MSDEKFFLDSADVELIFARQFWKKFLFTMTSAATVSTHLLTVPTYLLYLPTYLLCVTTYLLSLASYLLTVAPAELLQFTTHLL